MSYFNAHNIKMEMAGQKMSTSETQPLNRVAIGDMVDVGGCVGVVSDWVDDDFYHVEGSYVYSDGSDEPGSGFAEPWHFRYPKHLFKEKSISNYKFMNGSMEFWDMRKHTHT
jgi:hypothetical protein